MGTSMMGVGSILIEIGNVSILMVVGSILESIMMEMHTHKPFGLKNRFLNLDSRTPTEVTPLTARIKACCFHFLIISCTCCALAWIIGILCHHEISLYLINNPPKHAFNPQRVHDMLKLFF